VRRSRNSLFGYDRPCLRATCGHATARHCRSKHSLEGGRREDAISGGKGLGERSIETRESLPMMGTEWTIALACSTGHFVTHI